jgi:SAM-dependent methyltransferase
MSKNKKVVVDGREIITRLNVGAGCQPLEQYWNADLYEGKNIDQAFDLNKRWPLEDESVCHIFTSHCVEHLDDVTHFMREAHRVLRHGGSIEIRVPHGWATEAMGDPTHKRQLFPATFMSFCNGYGINESFNLQHESVRWDFDFTCSRMELIMKPWVRRLPLWRLWSTWLSNYILNMVGEFRVYITKN